MIKNPSDDDWIFCKQCTLNTIGKTSANLPTDEWKRKLLKSEHSPIRTLWFGFKMEIPYYISVHFVRHKFGVEHFVQSQRNDRQDRYDRTKAPQDSIVSHIMYLNAQELINMSHARLCNQASKETREVMREIVRLVDEANPEFKEVLVSKCEYRNGKCDEFFPCKQRSN
ncbi:MAG: FAD-dependent thymidylate synthase [Bacteroidaceae bacterium]